MAIIIYGKSEAGSSLNGINYEVALKELENLQWLPQSSEESEQSHNGLQPITSNR